MSDPVQVWVLVRDGDRAGVPVVLDRYLRWAASNGLGSFHVITRHGGPMVADWTSHAATVTVLEPHARRSLADGIAVAGTEVGLGHRLAGLRTHAWRRRVRNLPAPQVVLVHGAGAIGLLGVVDHRVPVVLHLHELATAIGRSVTDDALSSLLGRARAVLAVSAPVAELAHRIGAPLEQIDVVPGVIDDRATTDRREPEKAWMGGAGTPGWRKGTDRFAAVAATLNRAAAYGPTQWVGGPPAGRQALAHDAHDPVTWVPPRPDPWAVLDRAAVILIPSREDPLPLVALEAGHHSIAVVAARTGGLPDLLADGRGTVVDGHRLAAMTGAVRSLLDSPTEATDRGAALRDHVLTHHHPAVVGPTWWAHLEAAART